MAARLAALNDICETILLFQQPENTRQECGSHGIGSLPPPGQAFARPVDSRTTSSGSTVISSPGWAVL